jgi:hypothetical protein
VKTFGNIECKIRAEIEELLDRAGARLDDFDRVPLAQGVADCFDGVLGVPFRVQIVCAV